MIKGLPWWGSPVPRVLGEGSNDLYFYTDAVSISPSAGPELYANGDFDNWTADDPDDFDISGESAPDPEVTQRGSGQGHGDAPAGTGAANLYTTSSLLILLNPEILTAGRSYQTCVDVSHYVSGTLREYWAGNNGPYHTIAVSGQFSYGGIAEGAEVWHRVPSTGADLTLNSVSAKLLSSTMQLHSHAQPYGDFSVTLTRSDLYWAGGVVAEYTDDDNYTLLHTQGNQLRLLKWVSGVYTLIGEYAFTYGAGKTLMLRRHIDATLDILYDGSSIASGIAATGLTGTKGGAFATHDSNIAIGQYEWDARSAT